MIVGEAYVNVTTSPPGPTMSGMMSPMPGISMGGAGMTQEERVKWREKTGEKKGFLFKSDEVRTLALKGRRCLQCGYIELYAKE